jgi:hypothetical protein
MSTRRVVIGQQNDGTYGLRVSAAGVDAFVGDGQGRDFTFNSDWSDIAKIHLVGIGGYSLNPIGLPTINVTWPDLGYKPFFEIRKLVGNVVSDDTWVGSFPYGAHAAFGLANNSFNTGSAVVGQTALYIIYAIPVPSG